MQAVQHVAKLASPAQDGRLGQEARSLLHDLLQGLSVNVVHDQIGLAAFAEMIPHPGQVGVVQSGQDARLALELIVGRLPLLGRGVWIGHQFLDRP